MGSAIIRVEGTGLPLRGNDVDTDRIMPARFLKVVSFDGLEAHLFEDDRRAAAQHPFNQPQFRGAAVLVVNANFGCGSSREHAPQGLLRAGFRAIVGESFSEIFQGNAAMLGVPCVAAAADAVAALQALVERAPETRIIVDLEREEVAAGGLRCAGTVAPALRDAFVHGRWNPTAMLLEQFDQVRSVAGRLPYLNWS
jgi:3-isopropylmalate/(R)-2-methylmalate dehydratase small subunit